MMMVETFLLVPDTNVEVPLTPEQFNMKFINIENKERYQEIQKIIKDSNGEYYYGFIKVTYNNHILFGEEYIEYLLMYWIAITDLLYSFLEDEFVEMIVPGYEVKLSFTKINNNGIKIKCGNDIFNVAKKEFIIKLLNGGKYFFENHIQITSSSKYQIILDKIYSMLKSLVD